MTARVERPGVPTALAGHERRLRALERALSGQGIRFNVDNEGGWLYVVTNASTDISYGTTGLLLADTSGDGILLVSDSGGAQTLVSVDPLGIRLGTSAGAVLAVTQAGGVQILIRAANTVQVLNHLGNPIFEVREDGSLHGKTGQALTFDL